MPSAHWKSVKTPAHDDCIALLSYYPVKGVRDLPTIAKAYADIEDRLEHAPGLVGYEFHARPMVGKYWSVTLWEEENQADAFIDQHLGAAMDNFSNYIGPVKRIKWTVNSHGEAVDIDDVKHHWQEERPEFTMTIDEYIDSMH